MNEKRWNERLKQVMPWGSSTCSKAPVYLPEEPEIIVRGDGCRIWDANGKEYIDYRNGLGPVSLGYRYPAVDEAIRAQLERGIIFGHPSDLECEVAEQLCDLIPCAEQTRFLKTGGEALAACIRIARSYTERDHIIQIGYNGWLNSLASGANLLPAMKAEAAPSGVPQDLSSLHHVCAWNDTDGLEQLFARFDGQIAAVLVAADYLNMDQGKTFYPALKKICRKNNSLLIFDEVVTGFRLAVGGAQEYFGVVPDLAVFGKAMANGMPLAAYVGRRDIMESGQRGAIISSTFGGETLSLAAAKAVMGEYTNKDVIAHLWHQGEKLWSAVDMLFQAEDLPLRIRGCAPCPIIVEQKPGSSALSDFMRKAYANGVSLYRVPYITFSHTDEAVEETLKRLEAACQEVERTWS